MEDVIGDLVHKPSEFSVEWRIPDFFDLSEEIDVSYYSDIFFFSDAFWQLEMHPNGQTEHQSEGWIVLTLIRKDSGPPLTIKYSLGVRKADGTEEMKCKNILRQFLKSVWGLSKVLKREDLLTRKSELAPSGALTIICTLKHEGVHSTDAPLCRSLWNTAIMLKRILWREESTDVTLKGEDVGMDAHRLILKARSEVFDRMFVTDMKEAQTGEVNVQEADEDSLYVVLAYAYSGDPDGLSTENVFKVYRIAHKYQLKDLVRLCAKHMGECLSVDTFCDVLSLAEVYQEMTLKESAKRFFAENGTEVAKTEKWKALKKENLSIVSELLEGVFLEMTDKVKRLNVW